MARKSLVRRVSEKFNSGARKAALGLATLPVVLGVAGCDEDPAPANERVSDVRSYGEDNGGSYRRGNETREEDFYGIYDIENWWDGDEIKDEKFEEIREERREKLEEEIKRGCRGYLIVEEGTFKVILDDPKEGYNHFLYYGYKGNWEKNQDGSLRMILTEGLVRGSTVVYDTGRRVLEYIELESLDDGRIRFGVIASPGRYEGDPDKFDDKHFIGRKRPKDP